MKDIFKKVSVIISCAFFLSPSFVFAQGIKNIGGPLNAVVTPAGLQDKGEIAPIAGTTINAVLSFLGLIFFALMIYAGMMWMTARGDESKIEKAKGIISAAIIGLVVVVGAYAITAFVTSKFK